LNYFGDGLMRVIRDRLVVLVERMIEEIEIAGEAIEKGTKNFDSFRWEDQHVTWFRGITDGITGYQNCSQCVRLVAEEWERIYMQKPEEAW
jgi:hypothetical protein